jgi:cation diffusion facilitator family transporter
MAAADPAPGKLSSAETARMTHSIARWSVATAAFLITLKAISWLTSGSVAMLASLADSTLDLVASLFTFFAVRYAATPPDRDYRYGHGKAEAFAALFQAGLVAVSGAMIAVEAARRFFDPQIVRQGGPALIVMVVASVATMALVIAQSRVVQRTGSVAISGDRTHYAADLAGNIVVMIGVAAGAFLNWPRVDALAGLAVAAWLAWGAWEVARRASDHLMDRELPDAERQRIRDAALEDARVLGVHDFRTRSSGAFVHIQFHADLDPTLTLEAAHEIIVAAEDRIRRLYPAADIIIHPDPRDRARPHGHEAFQEGRAAVP